MQYIYYHGQLGITLKKNEVTLTNQMLMILVWKYVIMLNEKKYLNKYIQSRLFKVLL